MVFGFVGSSAQQIGGAQPPESVEMNGLRPFDHYVADENGDWVSPPVSVEALESERDRRLASAPFEYDFEDVRGVHVIGTDEKDMEAWIKEVMPAAQARLALSDITPIDIVTNTGPVSVTAMEWMAIISAGTSGRQEIWAAYFALIAMDPIPADYTDDKYWP